MNVGEPLPQLGFEVWVYAERTDRPDIGTYGGWGTLDLSGAGGATGLYWDQIHDPSTIEDDSEELTQYWRQIDHIVHELEHTFGAGYGEYYNSNPIVRDLTGIEPILPPLPAPNDFTTWPFWDEHEAYWADPLTANADGNARLGPLDTLESLLAAVRFGPATRGVINGLHRGVGISSLPDLSNVRVRVVDAETGDPIPHAAVRVWERPPPVWTATDQIEETVSPSSEAGVHLFTWTPYPHPAVQNNYSNMKLIKAWAAGYQPAAKWEWIYAAQEAKTLRGEDLFTIVLELQPD